MNRDARPAVDLAGLLAGDPVQRRTLLRGAALAALGLPAALAGCGKTVKLEENTSTYRIIYAAGGTNPPIGDLARLIGARARAVVMHPTLMVHNAGDLVPTLKAFTGLGAFDARTNTYQVQPLLVVAASQPAAIESILAQAIKHGTKIVAYPTALRHQTAAIRIDVVQAATMLAQHAAAWANTHNHGHGEVLLLLPNPADRGVLKPCQDDGPLIEQTLRAALARAAPGLTIVGSARSYYAALGEIVVRRALAAHPGVKMVLSWDDDPALGAATALGRHHSSAPHDSLYVGALGMPAVATRETLTVLARDDVLRVVIAARARDLANAMVDLPRTLLRGGSPRDIDLTLQTLTPGSAALTRYSQDYSRTPSQDVNGDTDLNPETPGG
jgi:ABC-type sugar transport system substrate-binding protein